MNFLALSFPPTFYVDIVFPSKVQAKWLLDAGFHPDIPPAANLGQSWHIQEFHLWCANLSKGHLIRKQKFFQQFEPGAVDWTCQPEEIQQVFLQVNLKKLPLSSRLLGMVPSCCMEFFQKGSG